MNIGFDAKRYFNNASGLGNYSRTLLGDLASNASKLDSFTLFYPGKKQSNFDLQSCQNCRQVSLYPMGNIRRVLGFKRALRQNNVDIYHGLSNELPLLIRHAGIPSVVTIHDVIFRRHPEDYPIFDRQIYDIKTALALKRATQIVAISHATQRDLIYYYNLPAERIQVIHQSVHPVFRGTKTPERPNRPDKVPKDYLLSVGTLSPRKNQIRLLEALALIPKDNRPFVVFIGKGSDRYLQSMKSLIDRHQLGLYTAILSDVSTSALPGWYRHAIASVYLSLFEGFGLPVIESLYSGTPVIASDIPSIREAAGPCANLVNPFEVEDIKKALEQPPALDQDKCTLHLEPFDPKITAHKWQNLYKTLVG